MKTVSFVGPSLAERCDIRSEIYIGIVCQIISPGSAVRFSIRDDYEIHNFILAIVKRTYRSTKLYLFKLYLSLLHGARMID